MTKQDVLAIARGLAPMLRDLYVRVTQLEIKERGIDGAVGPQGPPGPPGRDGMSVVGPPGRDGKDAAGKDGKDGADGLGFDDLEVCHDGERVVTLRFIKGDRIKESAVTFPVVIDRGVYQAGRTYQKGDGVTWAGSWWIAQDTTSEKPGNGATKWRLAVKAGRDGSDGKSGPQGPMGPKGDRGDPGRNFS